jgi:peptidoglycan/LPS O-acetylase OafA/YrhL
MLIKPAKDHLSVIYSLRGLAAFMVAFFHFTGWCDWTNGFYEKEDFIARIGHHGNMGVYIFFVISGFVIPYSLIKGDYRIRNFFNFIIKRSIRIELPYLITIGLFILVNYWLFKEFGNPFHFSFKRLFLHFLYLIPFTQERWFSGIFWTLGVEFQFYLVIALLIVLFTHRNRWVQFISLLGFISINFFELLHPDLSFIYSHTGIFAMGVAACLFYLKRLNTWRFIIIVLLGLVVTGYIKGWEIAVFALITVSIILFVKGSNSVGTFMGNISYSLYLTHALIGNNLIFLVLKVWKWDVSKHIILIWALAAAVGFAWLFWALVERPSKRLASRIRIGGKN